MAVGYFLISDSSNIKYVNIGGQKIQVELAVTVAERTQGLSGRQSLDEGTGLLFIFDKSGQYPFWMKDMNFSIDMVWMNDKKQVLNVAENVSPDTYPESFCPAEPAKYGLEINAGSATQAGITTGVTLKF